jgi:hypothetical protein
VITSTFEKVPDIGVCPMGEKLNLRVAPLRGEPVGKVAISKKNPARKRGKVHVVYGARGSAWDKPLSTRRG